MAKKYGVIWEDDSVQRAMQEAPATYRSTMRPALSMMLQVTRKELVKQSPGSGGGEGNLASSWGILQGFGGDLKGSVRSGVAYAHYVDQGRGPGKMPPYDAIEQWVHRLGLGSRLSGEEREEARPAHVTTAAKPRRERTERAARVATKDDDDREGIIWAIRQKIGARGTYDPKPPPKFVAKAHRRVEPRLEAIYVDAVNAFVSAVST